jgi:hypothetical protein
MPRATQPPTHYPKDKSNGASLAYEWVGAQPGSSAWPHRKQCVPYRYTIGTR